MMMAMMMMMTMMVRMVVVMMMMTLMLMMTMMVVVVMTLMLMLMLMMTMTMMTMTLVLMMMMMVRMVVVMMVVATMMVMMTMMTLMLMTTPSGRGGTPRSGRGTGHNPARVVILMMVMVVVMLVVVLILLASARTHAQLASYSGRRLAAALAAASPFWPRRPAPCRAAAPQSPAKSLGSAPAPGHLHPGTMFVARQGRRPEPSPAELGGLQRCRGRSGAQRRRPQTQTSVPCRARGPSGLPGGRSGAQGSVSGLLALGRCLAFGAACA